MTSGYFPGRDIKFTAGIKMPVEIYGDWAKEKASDKFYQECGSCERYFKTEAMKEIHQGLTEWQKTVADSIINIIQIKQAMEKMFVAFVINDSI